ncbi:MAG TPA: xanthine dehydrogenase family protein subunit M [Desulfobacteraceae bacterium]|nr:xanthine dehydrogenase family protein subunit M [Desulfobacteraceae bacterium]
MVLPKFQYHEPKNLGEACEIIAGLKENARPLAGGTDLLVNMKKGSISPKHVISLSKLEELKVLGIKNKHLNIGSCVTAAELAESTIVQHDFGALCAGAGNLGSPLIRNLATIGGNLISARPAADLPPSLMAYGGKAVLVKKGGQRSVDLKAFFKGPGETVAEPDEILSHIHLDTPPSYSGGGYVKLGKRNALEISIVNVAAFIALDSPDGAIRDVRIVLGSVGPVPLRAENAEKTLKGEVPGPSLFIKAGEAASRECKPIDDFRGSAWYRREMVAELTRRALTMAFIEAKARELRRWK